MLGLERRVVVGNALAAAVAGTVLVRSARARGGPGGRVLPLTGANELGHLV